MKKNDIIELEIVKCTCGGDGIGIVDGLVVFVPFSAVGDIIEAHILKVKKNCAYAKIHKIIKASPSRIDSGCEAFTKCGGCAFRHINYDEELRIKYEHVKETMRRIGHIDAEPEKIIGSAHIDNYRNKAQYPISLNNDRLDIGFYSPHSHRVVNCDGCKLQPAKFNEILKIFRDYIKKFNIPIYDETTNRGLLRHIYIRKAHNTGEILVCLVINGKSLPNTDYLVSELTNNIKDIESIYININRSKTNVILSDTCIKLWGKDYITDILCGLKINISPLSFYQVNTEQTEKLYQKAAEYAGLKDDDVLLDIYCGAGTIGLSMAESVKKLYGIEIIKEAVEDAKENAKINGIENAEFVCDDASKAAERFEKEGIKPNAVIVDPPRKGCSGELLETIAKMQPEKIIYISCDPATLARDCAILNSLGYILEKFTPVDMFPRTGHVECVVLLTHKSPDSHIKVKVKFDEGEGKIPLDKIAEKIKSN